jgi:hypothetical protein
MSIRKNKKGKNEIYFKKADTRTSREKKIKEK